MSVIWDSAVAEEINRRLITLCNLQRISLSTALNTFADKVILRERQRPITSYNTDRERIAEKLRRVIQLEDEEKVIPVCRKISDVLLDKKSEIEVEISKSKGTAILIDGEETEFYVASNELIAKFFREVGYGCEEIENNTSRIIYKVTFQ